MMLEEPQQRTAKPKDDSARGNGSWEERMPNPLVFLCRRCKYVLGDSFSMLSADEATRTVTLSGVTNVTPHSERIIPPPGVGRGRPFAKLGCRNCEAIVGKYHVAVSPRLASQGGTYIMNTDAMSSYQLGTCGLGNDEGRRKDGEEVGASETQSSHPADPPYQEELFRELTKMQGVLLALHDRILNVEGCDNRYKLGACDSRNEELPRASDEHIVPKGKSSLNCKNAADREAEAAGAEEKSAPRPLATPADKGETFRDVTKIQAVILALHKRILHIENINCVSLTGMPTQDRGHRLTEGRSKRRRTGK